MDGDLIVTNKDKCMGSYTQGLLMMRMGDRG